ncbi:MAG: 16S rRNA (guanine(527)-N(7))-methyltransferase RsmG [Coriobacteriia bacterium]|nr:16S rRNA (guanine(527)-N(7))-methyltransferase RsmG [Coriobacteriia bacterium]
MFHVKQLMTPGPPGEAAIRSALEAAGLVVPIEASTQLAEHASAVLESNRVLNLTRIIEPDDFIRLHIVDSLAPLKFINLRQGEGIDIGSGAGFPGIPLAIMGCRLTLCETRKKKAAYLRAWVEQLRLDVPVVAQRAEELVAGGGSYDWVVMRAVSSLASLLELASPLLRSRGRMVAMKGVRSKDEEERGECAGRLTGMRLVDIHEYRLPDGAEQRTLYIFERAGVVKTALPRRAGLAQKQPLG